MKKKHEHCVDMALNAQDTEDVYFLRGTSFGKNTDSAFFLGEGHEISEFDRSFVNKGMIGLCVISFMLLGVLWILTPIR
jgi:hypothetical protein